MKTEIEAKPVAGFPGYLVYRDGRIYSEKTGKFLRSSRNKAGARQVTLYTNGQQTNKLVSRVVAEAFLEGFDGRCTLVRCKDGDQMNCAADNLYFVHPSVVARESQAKRPRLIRGCRLLSRKVGGKRSLLRRTLQSEEVRCGTCDETIRRPEKESLLSWTARVGNFEAAHNRRDRYA